MNIGKTLFNATGVIAVASILAACGSSSSSSTAVTPAPATPVGGSAFKGPFVMGSSVTACPFAEAVTTGNCNTATTKATTTTTDANGSFSLSTVTWAGASLVTVSGNYLNEITGSTSQSGTLKAVLVLGAAGGSAVSANPNIATTIAAEILLAKAKANPVMVVDAAAAQSAGSAAAEALGLPLGTDPNTLTLSDPKMLTVSAAFADVLAAGTVDMAAVATSFAADVSAGQPLGTTPVPLVAGGTSNAIGGSLTTSIATASNVANYATPPAVTPVVVSTALKGYGLTGNALTVGLNNEVTCTVDAAAALPNTAVCPGNAPANAPVFNFNFGNYGGAATSVATTLTFEIADTAVVVGTAKRSIKGSVPVTLAVDAAGASATVPAGAVFTFSGVKSDGSAVSGTATNIGANVFSSNGSAVSFDMSAVAQTIINKIGTQANGLLQLTIPATYSFKFGTNAPLGLLDAANANIVRLVPIADTGMREVSGTVTIQ